MLTVNLPRDRPNVFGAKIYHLKDRPKMVWLAEEEGQVEPLFRDRLEAGRLLGEQLLSYQGSHPLLLGIPRGGVIVAAEAARLLNAPLGALVTRKLGSPYNKELAVGAVAPGGTAIYNQRLLDWLGLTEKDLANELEQELAEVNRRTNLYLGQRQMPARHGQTVILIDDGIATGMTAEAALLSLRQEEPKQLVLAAPVASQEAVARLQPVCDHLVILETPDYFEAVGQFYLDFRQVSDDQVLAALKRAG